MKFKRATALVLAGLCASTMALSGCGGIDKNATVLTMNGETISLGYANFVAKYQQANYDSIFTSYYGADFWTNESYADEDGKMMVDTVKENVIESIEKQLAMSQHLEDYDVEITDEQKAAMSEAAQAFMDANTKDGIKALGATKEYAEKLLYYNTVEKLMKEAIQATADTNVTDEECAQRTFSYIQVDASTYTEEDGTIHTYTDEEVAKLKETLEAAAAVAKNDMDLAASTYGYEVKTYSYGKDELDSDDAFDEAAIKAADALKEGEVSGVIQGEYYLYVIRLDSEYDEDKTESKKESLISERKEAKYNEVVDAYLEESDYTLDEKKWEEVEFTDSYTITYTTEDDSELSE